MIPHRPRKDVARTVGRALAFAALFILPATLTHGQPAKVAVLKIGSTGTITGKADAPKEKAGHETLRSFIKDETGFNNEIIGEMKWDDLAAKMAKGAFQLGVFQGFEFAWAQKAHPNLKPLAVGINVYRYPVACVIARKDGTSKDFAGLKGKTLAMPITPQEFLRLYIDRACEALGSNRDSFFSSIASSDNVEDALDDVVDGKAQATVIDQAALDAYSRRKPGRFKQLKEIARSQPFPPLVVAYYGSVLDDTTLRRFKAGLLDAAKKDKGEMLLTLSRLSGFEAVPADFRRALEEAGKNYPRVGVKPTK